MGEGRSINTRRSKVKMDIKPVGWKPDGTHINVLGIIVIIAAVLFTFDPYHWFGDDTPTPKTTTKEVVKEK